MATIVNAVRFNNLAEQLSDSEFSTFVDTFVKKLGRSFILSLIFHQLSNCNDDDRHILTDLISIVHKIIQNREKKDEIEVEARTMLSLSAPLIGEVGSYLKREDHVNYGLVSRTIYIGCNAPNSLRVLDLRPKWDYSKIDMYRYSQLRTLKFNLSAFPSFHFPSTRTMSKYLHKMVIDNDKRLSIAAFDDLAQCQSIRFSSITHLMLSDFSSIALSQRGSRLSAEDFIKLLSLFPNLQYLHLNGVYVQRFDSDQISQFMELLPALQVFVTKGVNSTSTREMIMAVAPRLKSLRCGFQLDLDTVSMSSLEELYIAPDTCAALLSKIKSDNGLKRLGLSYRGVWSVKPQRLIPKLIARWKGLEQLLIKAKLGQLKSVCTAIDRGIFDIVGKRDCLQIKLWMECDGSNLRAKDIVYHITKIISRLLYTSKIGHFVLIWRFWNAPRITNWNSALKKLEDQNKNTLEITSSTRSILVTNIGCCTSGAIQSYMMDDWMTSDI